MEPKQLNPQKYIYQRIRPFWLRKLLFKYQGQNKSRNIIREAHISFEIISYQYAIYGVRRNFDLWV